MWTRVYHLTHDTLNELKSWNLRRLRGWEKFDKRTEPIASLWWTEISSNNRFFHHIERCVWYRVDGKWKRETPKNFKEIRKHHWLHATLCWPHDDNVEKYFTLTEWENSRLPLCIEKILWLRIVNRFANIVGCFQFPCDGKQMETPTCDSADKDARSFQWFVVVFVFICRESDSSSFERVYQVMCCCWGTYRSMAQFLFQSTYHWISVYSPYFCYYTWFTKFKVYYIQSNFSL